VQPSCNRIATVNESFQVRYVRQLNDQKEMRREDRLASNYLMSKTGEKNPSVASNYLVDHRTRNTPNYLVSIDSGEVCSGG